MNALTPVGQFDYGALPQEIAEEARVVAVRIRERGWTAIIETGHDLSGIKKKLGHGNFLPWIYAEFGMSERTSRNYMSAAKHFSKSATVADLPPNLVYKLAANSTPDHVREEIVEQIEAGDITTPHTIAARLDAAMAEAARGSPRHKRRTRRNSAALRRHQREQQETQQETTERRAAEVQAANLVVSAVGDDLSALIALMHKAGGAISVSAIEEAAYGKRTIHIPAMLRA